MTEIQFLYFNDCPGHEHAWRVLQEALRESGTDARIERVEVTRPEDAARLRFLGSPSIRINGRDLEDSADELGYGWRCRYYEDSEPGQPRAVPSKQLILSRLDEPKP